MNLGDIIRKQLTKKSMTQTELANKINVGQRTISNYVNNNSFPDLETLFLICQELEINLYSLIDPDKIEQNPYIITTQDEYDLIQLFRRVPQNKQGALLQAMRTIFDLTLK